MPEHSDQFRTEKLYLLILGLVGLARFYNLGFLDLQAWDEALYAVRAQGILKFRGWIDQSPFAIDGLYSALHPPLYVWLTAAAFSAFGETEFAARFFSALFAALTLFVIYAIGRRIDSPRLGLVAATLYGLNPFVTFYARQGQFDSTLVFFLSAAIYFVLQGENNRNVFLSGLATGFALMTKLFVGLGIPVVYLLMIALNRDRRIASWAGLGLLLAGAALVALPWHLTMTVLHGGGDPLFFIRSSALVERALYGVEGNIKPLEFFYYINQLAVLFPVGAAFLASGALHLTRRPDRSWMVLLLWFLLFFAVFSLMRTKLAVYVLPMLVPASLIAAREVLRLSSGIIERRKAVLLIVATGLLTLWASSQTWRNEVKEILRDIVALRVPQQEILLSFSLFLAAAAAIIIIGSALTHSRVSNHAFHAFPLVVMILLAGWSLTHVAVLDRHQYVDGAAALASFVQQENIDRIVVAGYERNPQLTYYFGGIDIGWRRDISFRRILPPRDTTLFHSWLTMETATEPSDALLVIEKDKLIRYRLFDPLGFVPPDFELVFDSRRYAAFLRTRLVFFAIREARNERE